MRKTKDIAISDEGRDKGKVYRITEMPAAQAEAWAIRAMLAIGRARGSNVPSDLSGAGWAGLMVMGITSLISMDYEDAEPLLTEMFTCVKIVMPLGVRDLLSSGDDIEEPQTRFKLRAEIFALHTDFSIADFLSILRTLVGVKSAESLNTETPAKPLES